MKIYFGGDIKKFHTYRKARLINWLAKMELNNDEMNQLGRYLRKQGYLMDNHIVFVTERGPFWFSDNHLYIGGEVIEGIY